MHEWAMVYQAPAVRHSQVPLRLGPAGTDAVVESIPLRCSHFDAYRFFTEPATHRNAEELTRDNQVAKEQPAAFTPRWIATNGHSSSVPWWSRGW